MSPSEDALRVFEGDLVLAIEHVDACVATFRGTEDVDLQFLFAERLPTLGSAALPALRKILDDPEVSGSLRYLAAWVALQIGDRGDSVAVLCREVETATRWSLPAAGALAQFGIREGVGPVLAALSRVDPQDTAEVIGYVTALRDLGGDLPTPARERFRSEGPRWMMRAIEDDFPEV
ncbi:hypothetical protein [Aeromicrobium choanae]|uniref:hypothetical protein n=1 Tax=Aeromicrobium choanae TaxID=1736691 RepID=UPI00099AEE6F|nr:hypothetical protein [Aeromicrobium choanae]